MQTVKQHHYSSFVEHLSPIRS